MKFGIIGVDAIKHSKIESNNVSPSASVKSFLKRDKVEAVMTC